MKRKKLKKNSLFLMFLIFIMSTINFAFSNNVGFATNDYAGNVSLEEASTNSLLDNSFAVGFDVTGNQELYDSGFKQSNPILRPLKEGLYKNLTKIEHDLKSTEAGSSVEYSEIEAIKKSKSAIGGGLNLNISVVNIDINAAFDKNVGLSNTRKERFETYFQYNTNIAYVLRGNYDYRDYLTEEFESALHAISSEADANKLFDKYGTHLLTGLTFGGLLQICNYQATTSASKKFDKTKKIEGYIDLCAGFVKDDTAFSFKEAIENEENKNNSKSTYECHIYGGKSITSVTMDHLFTYKPDLVGGKGQYVYGEWVESINEGKNLVPLGLYPDSKAYPVWDLLPSSGAFNKTRNIILNAYKKRCGSRYNDFLKKFPEAERKEQIADKELGVAQINGYSVTTKENNTSYFEYDKNHADKLYAYKDSEIYINSEDTIPVENRKWKVVNGQNVVKCTDDFEGIFKVNDNALKGNQFTVGLFNNETSIKEMTFTVNTCEFSGGLGTEEDPYKINNKNDFLTLIRESGYWSNHFILTNDLDLNGEAINPIGKATTPFAGSFDGNHKTISNFKITAPLPEEKSLALFAYNNGTIKNLNIGSKTGPVTIGTYEEPTKPNVFSLNYVGSLVGYNKGQIINCHVENINIDFKDYYAEAENNLIVGGFVGVSTVGDNSSTSRINQCSAQINSLDARSYYQNDEAKGNTTITVGGFIGDTDKTLVDNCILQKAANIYAKGKCENAIVNVGGFIGSTSKNTNMENCVLGKTSNIDFGLSLIGTSTISKNLFVGKVNGNTNIKNCSAVEYVATPEKQLDTGVLNDGCTIQTKLNIVNCKLSSTSWIDGKEYPLLRAQTMDPNNPIIIDPSLAKTNYYYGEALNIAGIKIKGLTMDPDNPFNIPYFTVDKTSFNPTKIGTQLVKVNVNGKTLTYEVRVNKIKIRGISAKANKAEFNSNESITSNDINVYLILENGTKVLYDANNLDPKIVYPEDRTILASPDGDLVLGDNIIYVDFGGQYQTETICKVHRDELESLNIEKVPTKLNYKVGETFSTNGMRIKAKYRSGYTKMLNNEDLEIFGENIVEGTNKVQISYDNYTTVEQEVTGVMPKYTIRFEDADGNVIDEKVYEKGELIVEPEHPTKEKDEKYIYTFDKWDNEIGKCNSDMTFKPIFKKEAIKYTITFVDDNNKVISEKEYTYGETVLEPKIPLKESDGKFDYTFESWDKEITSCDGHKTYKAIFKANPVSHGTNLGLAIGIPVGVLALALIVFLIIKSKHPKK